MDGHTTAIIMHIIPILIMVTTLITIIMDRVTTQIQTNMWQVVGGEALQKGELQI
jgi:hypothetical protein